MNKIAVFASGNGSNFEALVKAQNNFEAEVSLLIVNKPNAYVIERAKKLGIEFIVLDSNNYESREKYEGALISILEDKGIEYILLAGFMRILTSVIINKFEHRIINIHPSLLPRYPGVAAIKQAFEAGDKETGVTIHYVDQGLDTGEIILQEKVKIEENDTLETLTKRIHELEHKLYPEAVKVVLDKE